MATALTGIQPLYQTGSQQPGAPKYGQGAYGMIPQLPKYTTDTTQQIGTDVQSQMIANLPNYLSMVSGDIGNITANIEGQVSPQTTNLLAQQAAEWGQATGSPLSQAAATNFLAKYGLTSAQMQALGHQQLTQAMQRTPIQQTNLGTNTQDLSAQQAIYNAAPDPAQAEAARLAALRSGIGAGGVGGSGIRAPAATAAPTQGMGYDMGGGFPGAGYTGMQSTVPSYQDWSNPFAAGSSPYGSVGGGQLDMFDPSGMLQSYGQMPDYSGGNQPGYMTGGLGLDLGSPDFGANMGQVDQGYENWLSMFD